MAKAKITESHSITVEGVLSVNMDSGLITLDVEDIGTKRLADIIKALDGNTVKGAFKLNEEIFD